MTRYVFKMPDLGEGTVEAEVVAWHVQVGDYVQEDQLMAEIMTDKAAVEVPSPVTGRVVALNGQPGDVVRVGAELVVFETESNADLDAPVETALSQSAGMAADLPAEPVKVAPSVGLQGAAPSVVPVVGSVAHGVVPEQTRVKASPATRRRAREAGVDLRALAGSGPGGRITSDDLAAAVTSEPASANAPAAGHAATAVRTGTVETRVIGIRRLIAQRMLEAKRNVPHFTYVEEIDVTELESLRQHLNGRLVAGTPALSYLPFISLALVRVLERYPQCNALYDAERGVLVRHHAVHLGIATQTPDGLKVPVVRHAEALTLQAMAAAIRRVSESARSGKATGKDLTGSTITITSLGKLGGIVSTPIINVPEMAIIGVNKAVERPVVLGGAVTVRRIMNLSSSFDHRFVDGYDAAAMIQAMKDLIEHPATIFMPS